MEVSVFCPPGTVGCKLIFEHHQPGVVVVIGERKYVRLGLEGDDVMFRVTAPALPKKLY
jgi:hypothetical protein